MVRPPSGYGTGVTGPTGRPRSANLPGVRKPRPERPRLVEQLRILLWFQMHLTLLGLLVVLIVAGTFSNIRLAHHFVDQLLRMALLLVGIAVALPLCARLLRRGWFWAYPVILAIEAAVIFVIVQAVAFGLVGTLLVLLYAALTGWILADLCRREVRAYLFRLRGELGTGPAAVGE